MLEKVNIISEDKFIRYTFYRSYKDITKEILNKSWSLPAARWPATPGPKASNKGRGGCYNYYCRGI